jgi:uncharacterized membrane protein YeaQ/YmgE (transglycosylase-associated protein family)
MNIAFWIIVGLVAGSIARLAMPGPAAGGMRVAMLIGLVGAIFGGLLGTTISPNIAAPVNLYAAFLAAIGAMTLLFLYRCFAMRFEENQIEPRPRLFSESSPLVIESGEMIRVTFDRHYMDNLEDYYRRNECIREQQYLSQDKLLHLAAFCLSKVADATDERRQSRPGERAEAAADVIRQLSLLCGREGGQAEDPIRSLIPSTANGSVKAEQVIGTRRPVKAT